MHLCFSITAHGFGHGAISCSVINRVMAYYPEIKISVMSLLPKHYLTSRLASSFDYYPMGSDFGMLMASPIVVDVANSRSKYHALYENWHSFVEQEKLLFKKILPDIVISNISPISLDAAHQLGIRTASVAPFNWAQIYKAYCLDDDVQTRAVYQKMNQAYQAVDQVFKPLPFVPLYDDSEITIASINDQPIADLEGLLGKLPSGVQKIGLIALGGLPFPLDLENWPKVAGLQWLVDQSVSDGRSDITQIGELNIPFLTLVACSDLIITKPGYGTYCEIAALAVHQKIRALTLVRPDWPETPYLNKFLSDRVPFVEIEAAGLVGEALTQTIESLNQLAYPETFNCEDGAMQLVEKLLDTNR